MQQITMVGHLLYLPFQMRTQKFFFWISFTLTTQIAWKLLQKGADPSAKAEEGSNALHYLCRRGNMGQSPDKYYEKVFNTLIKDKS